MSLPPLAGDEIAGRSIQLVTDLKVKEQLYLLERARRLKAKHCSSGADDGAPPLCKVEDADISEQVNDPDATVYLLFMEGSTRTKESLRNAAEFHGVKVNEFQAETSSFQKNETFTDTMKMLSVYSTRRSIFVIRSPLEGVCRWLQTVIPKHTDRFGIPRPSFVNAGDGRYTHPIGEFVDMFAILQQRKWHRDSVHIALVGDLAHGRTAHTKVEGLKIFDEVSVDLVAPEALAYPVEYVNKMRQNGFTVRQFDSLESYLKSGGKLAPIFFFYKPQFHRCGDLAPAVLNALRAKVTFRPEWREQLPEGVAFFQTLPRDQKNPVVPLSFDSLPLNRWDSVANDAYYVHIVLLGMLFGRLGRNLPAASAQSPPPQMMAGSGLPPPLLLSGELGLAASFAESMDLSGKDHTRRPERARPGGALPLKDGLVIDHIGQSMDAQKCWRQLRSIRTILGWSKYVGSEGVYSSTSQSGQLKGIISLPNFEIDKVTLPELQTLASTAPGCTVNAISLSRVVAKYRLSVPEKIYNLANTRCKNTLCVSNPKNKQRDVVAYFERRDFYETSALPGAKWGDAVYLFICKYCQWPHLYEDIWAEAFTAGALGS